MRCTIHAMILVDDQAGSESLFPYIQALTTDVIKTRIHPPFGDCVWYGNGPDGTQLRIAVEYKQVEELLASIIDGRFGGHQVEGLVNHYDRRYLLVEMGSNSFDRNTGVMMKRKGERWYPVRINGREVTYRDMEHWNTTIEEQAQFRVKWTRDQYESARWVHAKYTWYVNKAWEDHAALKQFHVKPPPTMAFVKPTLLRRVAKELPQIGWDKSINVQAKFRSVRQMICASEQDWRQVDGIGTTIAHNIVVAVTDESGY